MTYTVSWGADDDHPSGQHVVEVATPGDLDDALNALDASGQLFVVDIYRSDDEHDIPFGLQLGIGHPERSFVIYLGDQPAAGLAVDRSLPEWPEDITFDYGGEPTDYHPNQTRVTSRQARDAAREYMQTGKRPTHLHWDTGDALAA
ncbi:Imm1 family immunity protein [Actinocatenispora comari]|uniref:Immunity protein Imm1 n=1 Tax=Actinocatenispora comari TaxID=2807577 RepID=A0A8J4AIX4_9ACTN|nr:Imm1 family immunity protein [Actinocatenispora comari]GIL32038.1 hypothetical protein NUM_72920 [Actinocatenispora comari]